MERHSTKAERILTKIQDKTGGVLKISQKGVPHLVIGGRGGLSACYFCSTREVKVFDNYGTGVKQNVEAFKSWPEAVHFIQTGERFI